jgi:hypothetical protein
MAKIDAIKVFSATKHRERVVLGDVATEWIEQQKGKLFVVDKIVTQSSDNEFHCLSITLFCSKWKDRDGA